MLFSGLFALSVALHLMRPDNWSTNSLNHPFSRPRLLLLEESHTRLEIFVLHSSKRFFAETRVGRNWRNQISLSGVEKRLGIDVISCCFERTFAAASVEAS